MLRTMTIVVLLAGCDGAAVPADGGGLDDAITITATPTGERVSITVIAEAGAIVTLTTPRHTYALDISPGSLEEDTEITIEEMESPELPGAAIVRFSPDGLTFLEPAVLTIDQDADPQYLGLSFHAGTPGAEALWPARLEGGMAIVIEHFSEAALTPFDVAVRAFPAEARRDLIRARDTGDVHGLRALWFGRVEPAMANAEFDRFYLRHAGEWELAWRNGVALVALERPGFDQIEFAPPILEQTTLGDLGARTTEVFIGHADALLGKRTAPMCLAEREIGRTRDWLIAPVAVLSILQEYGEARSPRYCVTPVLTLTGPSELGDARTVTVTAALNLEPEPELALWGPPVDDEDQTILRNNNTVLALFDVTGASTPSRSIEMPNGTIDFVLTRPTGPTPPTTITVDAVAVNPFLGFVELFGTSPVATYTVGSPLVVQLTAEPPLLTAPGSTRVCVATTRDGVTVREMPTVTWTERTMLGTFSGPVRDGALFRDCIDYTVPAPFPSSPTPVEIEADVVIAGQRGTGSIEVGLGPGNVFAGAVGVASSCVSAGGSMTVDCGDGGAPRGGEIFDTRSLSVAATLRVTVVGSTVLVEASAVDASEGSDHTVDERHMPQISSSMTSATSATGSIGADGRIRVRLCGTANVRTTQESLCSGTVTETSGTAAACFELLLAPSPAVSPTELVPVVIPICGSGTSFGSLVRE